MVKRKKIPGPKVSPLFGLGREMKRDSLGLIQKLQDNYGDIVNMPLPGLKAYLINDPELIKIVLTQTETNFFKSKSYHLMKPAFGLGLLTSEGELWKRQRTLANPLFGPKMNEKFEESIKIVTEEMVKTWQEGTINIHAEMLALTLKMVVRSLFSNDIKEDTKEISAHFNHIQDFIQERFWTPFPLPTFIPTPKNLRFKKSKNYLDSIIYRIINKRHKSPSREKDFLDLFLDAGMPVKQVRDEVITMILAGQDTTANAITFTLYLLASNPEKFDILKKELKEVLGGRSPGLLDLPKLPYTKMVFEEALRLYPPAWGISRVSGIDLKYQDYLFPKGSVFIMTQFTLHRHKKYWEDPLEFRPERFLPENQKKRHKFAYFPFGGGSRTCIGMGLAFMEAQMVLGSILQKFKFELTEESNFTLSPRITLSPNPGIKMRVSPL